jgi:DegV family protein with EDD domain
LSVGIRYVDGPRLARSLHAAADWVAAGREDINRINVYPVPDGDTGTNFSLTLRSVSDALRALGDASLGVTAATAARGAVLGARGNSGMMLAHFLLGFAETMEGRQQATAPEIARGFRRGAEQLYASLDDPREGTILTVAREAATFAERAAADSPDVSVFMTRLLREGERSLAHTPELMAVLKDAGVVDAGGMGFVRMIEGVVRYIAGDPILPAAAGYTGEYAIPAAHVEVAAERDHQFCTEVMVRGPQLPGANEVRSQIRGFGDSVQVVVAGDILKVHVHTDTPEAVFTYAARWGTVEMTKAEDMRAQHRKLAHGDRRPVAIVVDSTVDLPDAVLDRHHIMMVPLQVMFGDETMKDRVELRPDEFYRRMRLHPKVIPTTSQPTPGEFARVLREARARADEVVAVLVAAKLSGTYQSGVTAARVAQVDRVEFVDSGSASLGLGMLALRGAELAESGWGAGAVAEEMRRIRRQSGAMITVDRFDNLLRSGRVTRGKALIGGLLDVKPILGLDLEGRVLPLDRVRGRRNLIPRVLRLLEQRLTPRPKVVRFGIAHAEAPEAAERLRDALVAAYQPRDCFVSLATGVLGTHVGIGAWAVFYQVEDGTPLRPREQHDAA